ncbi:hypothetical protein [Bacteriovorax sp. Seq25_V]|uniref:hypothetical protein n=1 Tax=Bacteriovorax sp. Seq25_V TaxID=1201288 RepID=UPI00038A1AA1|nr:hypothetical protein [Bacteriovorax sp. Seq25_V]EQC47313.1 hypothetical protein M900_0715 [Bacteriovorax sp. Seq25_V]
MNLAKFHIISDRDVQALEETTTPVLLNIDHIISIKPINIVMESGVTQGYWIRMSNGKKYRAIMIPKELASLLGTPSSIDEDVE